MDNPIDQFRSKTRRKITPLGSLLQNFSKMKKWLVASFVVTEEEKIDAGINIDRLGRR